MRPYYDQDGVAIYHGDCREVLPTLGKVDLVVMDPPYRSLDVEVATGTTTRLLKPRDAFVGKRLASSNGRRWFSTIPDEQLGEVFVELRRHLADSGALYCFADVKSALNLFPSLGPANMLVWDKQAIGMGYHWRRMYELIAFCPMPKHELRDKGLGDILRCPGVEKKVHPREKPVRLFLRILNNSTDHGGTILDPFCGTGPVLRAAKDLGRHAVGIESEERFCEIAAKRLEQGVLAFE
jgi:site-specific DNA-methyltransferase (adenine-specific)